MQGKRSIRLIAFDLDGTVLDDHKKILPQTKAALESAAGRGIEIVPATGRPYCGLSPEIDRLQGVRYVLTCNGAGVYEKETGKCRMESGMSLDSFLPLLAEVEPLPVMADPFVKGEKKPAAGGADTRTGGIEGVYPALAYPCSKFGGVFTETRG